VIVPKVGILPITLFTASVSQMSLSELTVRELGGLLLHTACGRPQRAVRSSCRFLDGIGITKAYRKTESTS